MGLDVLSAAAKDLAARAKENKLTPDEYKGSTFTVSNLGMFGIETFTPIINQPDAAILGVCAIADELDMDEEGKLFKKQVMRLSVTLDHRLLDGAVVAKFEMDLRDLLQNPMQIVL
jgi:pyruvate dehydrogenase E2 component (dihydrolipoamide acetyltransferase)